MTPAQIAPLLHRALTSHICPSCGENMNAGRAVAWLPDNTAALACSACETQLVGDNDAAWVVVTLTSDDTITLSLPATVDGLRMDTSMLSGDDHPIMTTVQATLATHTYPLLIDGKLNRSVPALCDHIDGHYDATTPDEQAALANILSKSATHIALCPHTSATYMENRAADAPVYSVDIGADNVTSTDIATVLRPICDWHLTESV